MTTYIPYLTIPAFILRNPAASVLLPIACGLGVGFAIQPQRTVKLIDTIRNPPLQPPSWVFGPTWTLLYGLMGFAAYRAWSIGNASLNPNTVALAKHGATLYSIQLGLNLIYMPLFFGLQRPIEATVDIAALLGTIGYLIYVWGQVDEVAGWCLAPYLAWITFATYLSAGTGYLNGWSFKDKQVQRSEKKGQ